MAAVQGWLPCILCNLRTNTRSPKLFQESADRFHVEWIAAISAAAAFFQADPAALQRASIEKQRAAVQMQAQTAGARLKPWGNTIVEPGPAFFESAKFDCDALDGAVAAPLVEAAAKDEGVDAKLLRAVIDQESGFHPCAISSKGAQGLMQLMPGTAALFHVTDAFDPKQNIDAGAKYLKQLLDKSGGDIAKALAGYNAGPNADDPANTIPETKAYVDAILSKLGIKRTDPPSIQTPKPIGN
jgi:soluble lytic murein transglycosylase-like protein